MQTNWRPTVGEPVDHSLMLRLAAAQRTFGDTLLEFADRLTDEQRAQLPNEVLESYGGIMMELATLIQLNTVSNYVNFTNPSFVKALLRTKAEDDPNVS